MRVRMRVRNACAECVRTDLSHQLDQEATAKSTILNTQLLVFDTQFLVLNAQFLVF